MMHLRKKLTALRPNGRVLRRVWLRTTDIRCPLVGVWALVDENDAATDEPPLMRGANCRPALLAWRRAGSTTVHTAA